MESPPEFSSCRRRSRALAVNISPTYRRSSRNVSRPPPPTSLSLPSAGAVGVAEFNTAAVALPLQPPPSSFIIGFVLRRVMIGEKW